MSTLFSWSRWLGFFGRKAKPVKAGKRPAVRKHPQDFADYGTAFGLEMSLTNQAASDQIEAPASKPGRKAKTKPGKAVAREAVTPIR
ncbi:hypothetical protein Lcho_0945 [Leptothrix cholodnii SP-6]|uniref:Uncharacterized protein n=1 Tax=Leptothrix cholodnii (strain ATCC 51168 / LMG 8142 / SP-6) TaxID=395495 RepID=B1Y2K1_LEPCP|nr:hypothetical protein [Leptothrix cholodnii]ACB33217.1 hypothetical protein Lcho_0945 [Leptothrix cholodnii SP-6]